MRDRRKQIGVGILIATGALTTLVTLGVVVTTKLIPCLAHLSEPRFGVPHPEFTGGSVTVAGKHVVIHTTPVEQANARFLANLGDAVLERYARDTGSETLREPISLFLFDNAEDYARAAKLYNSGPQFSNPGFSRNGSVFMLFGQRPGEAVIASESGIAHLMAHELCHTLYERLCPNYDRQPSWLQEGVAEAWAERALDGIEGRKDNNSLWMSSMLQALRQKVRDGDTLSLDEIVGQSRAIYISADRMQSYLGYSRSFALVQMLDDPSPANASRRARFRAFLKEVNRLQGNDIARQADARFLEEFGGAYAADLQAELTRRVMTTPLSPWRVAANEVYTLADGALVAEAEPQHTAFAYDTEHKLSRSAHLHARIEIAPIGVPKAGLQFGRTALDDYYLLTLTSNEAVLHHYQKEWHMLAAQGLTGNPLTPGTHVLDLILRPQQISVHIDGHAATDFAFSDGAFPPGGWGVGVKDGRIIFRDLSALDDP